MEYEKLEAKIREKYNTAHSYSSSLAAGLPLRTESWNYWVGQANAFKECLDMLNAQKDTNIVINNKKVDKSRKCKCGCGTTITGHPNKLFVNSKHKDKYWNKKNGRYLGKFHSWSDVPLAPDPTANYDCDDDYDNEYGDCAFSGDAIGQD